MVRPGLFRIESDLLATVNSIVFSHSNLAHTLSFSLPFQSRSLGSFIWFGLVGFHYFCSLFIACPFLLPIAIYGKMHWENANGIMENSTLALWHMHKTSLYKTERVCQCVCRVRDVDDGLALMVVALRYKLSDFFIQEGFSYADYNSIKVQNARICTLHTPITHVSPSRTLTTAAHIQGRI